jgi:hypothetical protein
VDPLIELENLYLELMPFHTLKYAQLQHIFNVCEEQNRSTGSSKKNGGTLEMFTEQDEASLEAEIEAREILS